MRFLSIPQFAPFGVRQPSCRFAVAVAGLPTATSRSVCFSVSPCSSAPSAAFLRYLSLLSSATRLPRACLRRQANPRGLAPRKSEQRLTASSFDSSLRTSALSASLRYISGSSSETRHSPLATRHYFFKVHQ